MVEIISFPADDANTLEHHKRGLAATGKSFWAGFMPVQCLRFIQASPFEMPRLMFLYSYKDSTLGELADERKEYRFLEEIPTVIIGGPRLRYEPEFKLGFFNRVAWMPESEQFEPDGFVRIVNAYEAALAASPGQPVNPRSYALASRKLNGKRIA